MAAAIIFLITIGMYNSKVGSYLCSLMVLFSIFPLMFIIYDFMQKIVKSKTFRKGKINLDEEI